MSKVVSGRIVASLGGLYTVKSGVNKYKCRAKGAFRHEGVTPTVGDYAEVCFSDGEGEKSEEGFITKIHERKNLLLRPPVSNIDRLFIVSALKSPDPILLNIDKLTILSERNNIEPVIVFNKSDLASKEIIDEYSGIYRKSGFATFVLTKNDDEEVRKALLDMTRGVTSAFAGASGVGKSSLINILFPDLFLETGAVSAKTNRGRHTTRAVSLFEVGPDSYLADTPGFSLLDFERINDFKKEELASDFPEYREYLGNCKYTKCTHTKEEGCAIIEAVKSGLLPESRHDSYNVLYSELKNRKKWDK